jgi:selenide, water dikinase
VPRRSTRRRLLRVLQGLPSSDDPRVLIGMPAGDDAGVYQLDEDTALVQTVDVFTPSVDDPYVSARSRRPIR